MFETKDLCTFELKNLNEEGVFSGYGAIYNNRDQGGDMILPGAFDKSLTKYREQGKAPKMLWQHAPSHPIGKWTSLRSDDRGLYVEGKLLLDLQQAREIHSMMKNGIVDGLSIGYQTMQADREAGTRKLKELELWEISVVTFPMNTDATITGMKQIESVRDIERILREAGVSSSFSKLVAAHGFKEAKRRLGDCREGDAELSAADINRLLVEIRSIGE